MLHEGNRHEDELPPLPERLTPHSLRRTFASLLYALGRTPPEVMQQLGHTDPKLALRIYAKAMRRDAGEVEKLRVLAGECVPDVYPEPNHVEARR